MKLRELINRLEQLSHNGVNDELEVRLNSGGDWNFFPSITSAWVGQEPDYNFDEANCGPEEWVELNVDAKLSVDDD